MGKWKLEDKYKECCHNEDCDGFETCIECWDEWAERNPPAPETMEVEKVAEMLRTMFDDDCACNYNGNDEWLPCICKYAETDCPTPKDRLGCWLEFVKHWGERNLI